MKQITTTKTTRKKNPLNFNLKCWTPYRICVTFDLTHQTNNVPNTDLFRIEKQITLKRWESLCPKKVQPKRIPDATGTWVDGAEVCNIHMNQAEWEAVIKWKTGKKEMLTA